jgi:hypothetical protein
MGFPGFDTRLLPDQLTKLTLSGVHFTRQFLSNREIRTLPLLTTLNLRSMDVDGRIQQYLTFPELKSLELSSVRFVSPPSSFLVFRQNPNPADALSENAFFNGIPNLERLSLIRMSANVALAAVIRKCISLQHLVMEHCEIEGFILSLIRYMPDRRIFPSLKSVHIDSSWPREFPMSYMEFARYCIRRRPELQVTGNEKPYVE